MARNRLNQCGIALYACYPTMWTPEETYLLSCVCVRVCVRVCASASLGNVSQIKPWPFCNGYCGTLELFTPKFRWFWAYVTAADVPVLCLEMWPDNSQQLEKTHVVTQKNTLPIMSIKLNWIIIIIIIREHCSWLLTARAIHVWLLTDWSPIFFFFIALFSQNWLECKTLHNQQFSQNKYSTFSSLKYSQYPEFYHSFTNILNSVYKTTKTTFKLSLVVFFSFFLVPWSFRATTWYFSRTNIKVSIHGTLISNSLNWRIWREEPCDSWLKTAGRSPSEIFEVSSLDWGPR